jgi:hypothetical protein
MNFKIKKGLFGGDTLLYDCPRCKTGLSSPLDDAGKPDACPECGQSFAIPGSDARDRIRNYQAEVAREQREAADAKKLARQMPHGGAIRWPPAGTLIVGALCLLVILALLAGLPDGDRSQRSEFAEPLPVNEAYISRAEYGEAWPFTVEDGILAGRARGRMGVVTFTTGGVTYGVNGIAVADPANAKVETIWAHNPNIPGLRINIGPIIDRGLSLANGVDQPYSAPIESTPPQTVTADLGPIRCDRFDIRAKVVGATSPESRTLQITLETDLPDETELMVSIDRSLLNQFDSETYPKEYFSEQSTVGQWRSTRTIELYHSQFVREVDDMKRLFRVAGEPLFVSRIDDSIEISFVVPVNQADPRFAPLNRNLEGAKVEVSGSLRNVRGVATLAWPIPTGLAR